MVEIKREVEVVEGNESSWKAEFPKGRVPRHAGAIVDLLAELFKTGKPIAGIFDKQKNKYVKVEKNS